MPKTKSSKVEKLEKDLAASTLVDTPEALEILIQKVKKAQRIFSTFSQEKVDAIFKAAATAADKARIPLARMAIEETGAHITEKYDLYLQLLYDRKSSKCFRDCGYFLRRRRYKIWIAV